MKAKRQMKTLVFVWLAAEIKERVGYEPEAHPPFTQANQLHHWLSFIHSRKNKLKREDERQQQVKE